MSDTLRNALWGAKNGAIMAALYSVLMLGIYAIIGRRAFHTPGLTLGKVLASYWVAGLSAGLLVGLLRPLARFRWGIGVVGAMAGVAVIAAFEASDKGPLWTWSVADWWTPVILGTIVGVVVAYDPRVGG